MLHIKMKRKKLSVFPSTGLEQINQAVQSLVSSVFDATDGWKTGSRGRGRHISVKHREVFKDVLPGLEH